MFMVELRLSEASKTPLLDRVQLPRDLKNLSAEQLRELADELRYETISAVAATGGHLGAGLGVVELTVALHYVFDTPTDRLIWDVGHQAYPHKILTGRRDRIRTLRQGGGLSGFTKRAESEYDPFGAAHSSTSISAALGMAVARDLEGKKHNVIAVIGDGAMSAGMAYEAMNNAGARKERLIVILNDNDMSIAPPVGAMSAYLARLGSARTYLKLRDVGKQFTKQLPKSWDRAITRAVEHARTYVTGGTLFEELGFYYVGPIDGHKLDHLLPVLRNVRDAEIGPILVHVVTQKGKGYGPAETSADKYHGVVKFDVATGAQAKSKGGAPQYTKVFGESARIPEGQRPIGIQRPICAGDKLVLLHGLHGRGDGRVARIGLGGTVVHVLDKAPHRHARRRTAGRATTADGIARGDSLVVCTVHGVHAVVPVVAAEGTARQAQLHDVVELAVAGIDLELAIVHYVIGAAQPGADFVAPAEMHRGEADRIVGRLRFLVQSNTQIQG